MNSTHRILVVDDEPYITDVVAAALRFEGFAREATVDSALGHGSTFEVVLPVYAGSRPGRGGW